VLYFGLFLGFAGLYFTYTRGSWLAGIMALIVAVILNRKHFGRLILPAVILAPMVAILFLGIGQDKFMKQRVENEDTLGSRLGTFVTATKVWRANPVFGVGIHQYRTIINDYIEPLNLPVIGVVTVSQFRDNPPHDIYVSFLAETGAVGVLLQGAIYFMILRIFLLKYRWRWIGDKFCFFLCGRHPLLLLRRYSIRV
jgi:O-antigen ligase